MSFNVLRSVAFPVLGRVVPSRAFATSSTVLKAATVAADKAVKAAAGTSTTKPKALKKAVTKTGTKSATKATTKPKAKPKKKTKTAEEIAKKKERDAAKKEKELAKKAEQKVKDKQRKEKEKAKAVKTKEKEAKASERALFKSLPSLPPLSPPSAYALYFKEFFGQNRDKYSNPDGKVLVQDVTRGAAKEWSNLPQSEVERFQQQAKAARAAWESEYSEFYESLTPEIIKALEKKTGKKISPPGGVAKAKLELKNRPGNPGRPASSFFEYVKSIRSELEQDPRVSELHEPLQRTRQVAIIAGERWKTLSQEEKDGWNESWKKAKARYEEWLATQPK